MVDVFYHCHGCRAIGSACPVADSCPISSASPPRSAVLECTHISSVDYTVIVGLGELLEDFQKKGVALAFVGLQVPVLRTLLAADLKGFRYFTTLEEAEKFLQQEPGTEPNSIHEDAVPEQRSSLLKSPSGP